MRARAAPGGKIAGLRTVARGASGGARAGPGRYSWKRPGPDSRGQGETRARNRCADGR